MIKKVLGWLIVLPLALSAGVITKTITFSQNDFIFTRSGDYDLITLPGQFSTTEKGKPQLPVYNLSVLIPPTAEITGVEIASGDFVDLPGTYLPYPVQPIRPLSRPDPVPFVNPDPAVYGSAKPYPAEIARTVPSGCLSGYRVAGVMVSPLQYSPADKKLRLALRLTLNIRYEEGRYEAVALTPGQIELFGREVEGLVVNPEAIPAWRPPEQTSRAGGVDYVVITGSSLVSAWNSFKTWKTKKGIVTEIMSTDTINAHYAGRDLQEKIRNFIKDRWQNKGLKYVLLGGDDVIVPDRKTRLVIEESTITGNIPTDMYYADLQWSWDGNHNNYFGEIGDTVDLLHDVYVGRAPIDNATNLAVFIRKDTMFEKHPDTTYMKTLLLPSEMLFNPYHGRVCNNIIAGYFPASGWQKSKLEDPGANATRDSLNRGFQLCHISDHGSPTSLSVLDMSQIPTLTNVNKLDVMNGINCDVGSFDGQDCIAESLVNYPGGGCIATLMNSRYGLGYPPALGPSEILDIDIFKSFIVYGIPEVGACHARAKNCSRNQAMSQPANRWVIFENTLFGDPNTAMYSEKPQHLTVSHAASIPACPQTFRVTASVAGVPLANALVCGQKGAEVYAVGRTNSAGWVDLFVSPATTGTMTVTVTAKNCLPYEGTCTVTSGTPRPCVVFQSDRINDALRGNNNGKLDPGETADLTVVLKNAGNAAATGVTARLRESSPYITLLDSTAAYGTINAGDTAVGDIFRVQAAANTPPGTTVEFIANASAAEGSWDPFFTETVGILPEPRLVWADHDTGCCVLSVTTYGGFGTTYPYGEGSGFKYSKLASNGCLYYGSMVCGTDPGYIVDRFYGVPAATTINQDFRVSDTLQPVLPPRLAQEEYEAVYTDSNHAAPKGLKVVQWSLMNSQPAYDDWVIVSFDYYNQGSSTITNFNSGMMFDFDIYNVQNNIVRSDTVRRFTYMMQSTTSMFPTAGIRLLQPKVFRNLSAIDNLLYVEPANMMTEAVKDSFLAGRIHLRNSTRTDNWSICVSAGPFTIPPGNRVRVVYAVVGGNDSTTAKVNSDSAQSWWDRNTIGVSEDAGFMPIARPRFFIRPNPAAGVVRVGYDVPIREDVNVRVYNAAGSLVTDLFSGKIEGSGAIAWRPGKLPAGIYFVKIEKASGDQISKFVYLK
jgi:hypothetical protein